MSESASPELRALWESHREMYASIVALRDVLVNEFGGHADSEGAVNGAIRILREQRAEIERLRGTGKIMRQGETIQEFYDRVKQDNPTLSKRVVFGRAGA